MLKHHASTDCRAQDISQQPHGAGYNMVAKGVWSRPATYQDGAQGCLQKYQQEAQQHPGEMRRPPVTCSKSCWPEMTNLLKWLLPHKVHAPAKAWEHRGHWPHHKLLCFCPKLSQDCLNQSQLLVKMLPKLQNVLPR